MRTALEQLTTDARIVESVASDILFSTDQEGTEGGEAIISFDPAALGVEWSEEQNEYDGMSVEVLAKALGIEESKGVPIIPGLAEFLDIANNYSEKANPVEFRKACETHGHTIRLNVREHQLAGIHKILSNAFLGRGLLLMDEVGLGKTLQLIAAMIIMVAFREHFLKTGDFPGDFRTYPSLSLRSCSHSIQRPGGKRFPSTEDGNIPDQPFLVVLPPSLLSQFLDEVARFVKAGRMDTFPYTLTHTKRGGTFKTLWDHSVQPPYRRMIVATSSVRPVVFLLPCSLLKRTYGPGHRERWKASPL